MIKVRLNGSPLFFASKEEAYISIASIADGYKTNSLENSRCCYALAMLMFGKTDIDCLSNEATQSIAAICAK